jgi:hypothetical protein
MTTLSFPRLQHFISANGLVDLATIIEELTGLHHLHNDEEGNNLYFLNVSQLTQSRREIVLRFTVIKDENGYHIMSIFQEREVVTKQEYTEANIIVTKTESESDSFNDDPRFSNYWINKGYQVTLVVPQRVVDPHRNGWTAAPLKTRLS